MGSRPNIPLSHCRRLDFTSQYATTGTPRGVWMFEIDAVEP